MVTKPPGTRASGSRPSPASPSRLPVSPSPSPSAAESAEVAAVASPLTGLRGWIETWRQRMRTTLRIIRANPTGRIALKVGVALTGALVVAVGIALIPLPGPGWALVILGLAIWAIEFVWAKHLLRFTRAQVHRWTEWVRRRSWPVRILLGLVGLVFVAVVLELSLKYSFGIDVLARVGKYVTTH
jgi:uncharacterized protein (TIGR02611 family)